MLQNGRGHCQFGQASIHPDWLPPLKTSKPSLWQGHRETLPPHVVADWNAGAARAERVFPLPKAEGPTPWRRVGSRYDCPSLVRCLSGPQHSLLTWDEKQEGMSASLERGCGTPGPFDPQWRLGCALPDDATKVAWGPS